MNNMPKPARAPQNASNLHMVRARLAAKYWAAVEDCLVKFHCLQRCDAASTVMSFQKRLADIPLFQADSGPMTTDFDDMIYHAEPWYIACNLADKEIPLEQHWSAYEDILRRNHLA